MNESSYTAVVKAIAPLEFIARSYHLANWFTAEQRTVLIHDLVVMLNHHDLLHVRLELLDARSAILFEFRMEFADGKRVGQVRDSARGVEVPVIDPSRVVSHRLLVHRSGKEPLYQHLLKMIWGSAEVLSKVAGDEIESEHAGKVTGGRQKGTIFVNAAARHNLVVTQAFPSRGYAFARDLHLGRDGVFLLSSHAPAGLDLLPGVRLQAIVIQTPRGLQGRALRALKNA